MGQAVDVFKLNDVKIAGAELNVVFSGTENVSTAAIEEVMIDTVAYDTAKTINQLDGVLYVGNTTGSKDVGYQKWANNIRVTSTRYAVNNFDTFYATVDNFMTSWGTRPVNWYNGAVQNTYNSTSYRSPELNSTMRGYQRGEVYALYLAFILKDGSMSYAYHIPGRDVKSESEIRTKDAGVQMNPNAPEVPSMWASQDDDYRKALFELPDGAYYSQLWDFSNASANFMNFWKNLTEFYPDTDDYDIMDGNVSAGTLRNTNVRHHHFPNNGRDDNKSISDFDYTDTAVSDGSTDTNLQIDGEWVFRFDGGGMTCGAEYPEGSWGGEGGAIRFNQIEDWTTPSGNPTANNPVPATTEDMGWNTTTNVWTCPNQPMTISISYSTAAMRRSGHGGQAEPTRSRIHCIIGGTDYYSKRVSGTYDNDGNFSGGGNDANDGRINSEGNVTKVYPESAWSNSGSSWWREGSPDENDAIDLEMNSGDKFWIEGRAGTQGNNWDVCQRGWNLNGDFSYHVDRLRIFINAGGSSSLNGDQYDAKITQTVNLLGFHLEDVKIPKNIADQVQGFRIYRAKRGHENKTVLGQSVLLPMHQLEAEIGLCSDISDGDVNIAATLMGQVSTVREKFYTKHPWALEATTDNYPDPNATESDSGSPKYKAFSFYDFNLLRTKNSLSPATYLQVQYVVKNYVWNGPSLRQDKKMLTKITNPGALDTGSTEAINFEEFWGYDPDYNCYPQDINSAIFIGAQYDNAGWHGHKPKFLGQKARTYLLGDSIFSGTSLGFGGKVFNEHGNSAIILALKDDYELEALVSTPEGDTDATSFGVGLNDATVNLINPDLANRSKSYIANLKAYKSDVYKSIDSQELVYTGYEIVGDELNNFVYDPDATVNTTDPINNTGDSDLWWSTQRYHTDGVFGGDTFLCRYGFMAKVTPSNSEEKSNPLRALYYHIVESCDNINFRHIEDDESLYFPGTSAKEILSSDKDLTHVDNIKYNANYSEDNQVKPAFPLPLRNVLQDSFPTRTHRSAVSDPTSLIDNYRIFLANQYKDLPKNRGDLNLLSSFNNLLYFHMDSSLYAAKGKQSMQMKDGSEAFVGSGDIFQQNPDEVIQTELGYGGTNSQWAALTTRYGYFFVDKKSGKVFMMGQTLEEISAAGMENWFRENLKSDFIEFSLLPPHMQDNPVYGIGLHSIWDPENKRILLTYNDYKGTQRFIDERADNTLQLNEETGTYYVREHIFPYADDDPLVEHYVNIFHTNNHIVRNGNDAYQMFGLITNDIIDQAQNGVYIKNHYMDSLEPAGSPINHWIIYTPPYTSTTEAFNMGYDDTDLLGVATIPQAYQQTWGQTDNPYYSEQAYYQFVTFNYEAAIIWLRGTFADVMITFEDRKYFTPTGWTISYYPETKMWGSFHSYLPYKYFNTHSKIYSLTTDTLENASQVIWEHGTGDYGSYYGNPDRFKFIFEFINNSLAAEETLTYSLSYTADVYSQVDAQILQAGFSSLYIYNTTQLSGNVALDYLVTTRKIGNAWKVNKFRDMAANFEYIGGYYANQQVNVVGEVNTSAISTMQVPMFLVDGMNENINPVYLNLNKPWHLQKKFVDKWVGIRLICDNRRNNLVNLYSVSVGARKYHR